jgi:hypothetical protein
MHIYVVNHVSISEFILHSSHFIMNKIQREKKLMKKKTYKTILIIYKQKSTLHM